MIARDRLWLWIGRLARWGLAAVFLYAGLAKAWDPALLARQIKSYHLAPWWMVHPLAIVLPWVEIAAGLLLIAGRWIMESASMLGALAIVFIAAVGWALHRDLHIQCGCFGGDAMVSWGHIAGNVGLLTLAGLAMAACRASQQAAPSLEVGSLPATDGSRRE